MAFGDEIGRAEIKKRAGEHRQHVAQRTGRHARQLRGENAQHRRGRIQQQPGQRAAPARAAAQQESHRVDAVGEIMCDHRHRDDQADRGRRLEAEADGGAVHEAVRRSVTAPAMPRVDGAWPWSS